MQVHVVDYQCGLKGKSAMTHESLAKLDDDLLAQRASKGDHVALEMLLNRFAPTAARTAFNLLGNQDDALDAAQTALIQVANTLESAWSGKHFCAWLCVCAHSAALNLRRQNFNRKRREQEIAGADSLEEAYMPEHPIERQELCAILRDEITSLQPETSLVVTQYYLQGVPVAEIASQTGLSVENCWQRLKRGRDKLRERLERRGVTLANVAMLAGIFGEISSAGKAWATALDPQLISTLVKTALSGRTTNSAPAQESTRAMSGGTIGFKILLAGFGLIALATISFIVMKDADFLEATGSQALQTPSQRRDSIAEVETKNTKSAAISLPRKEAGSSDVFHKVDFQNELSGWSFNGVLADAVKTEWNGKSIWALKLTTENKTDFGNVLYKIPLPPTGFAFEFDLMINSAFERPRNWSPNFRVKGENQPKANRDSVRLARRSPDFQWFHFRFECPCSMKDGKPDWQAVRHEKWFFDGELWASNDQMGEPEGFTLDLLNGCWLIANIQITPLVEADPTKNEANDF